MDFLNWVYDLVRKNYGNIIKGKNQFDKKSDEELYTFISK